MHRSTLRTTVLTAALVATQLWATDGRAQGLLVSPVTLDVSVKKSGDTLPPITVRNAGKQPAEIECTFTPLTHDVYGAPKQGVSNWQHDGVPLFTAKPARFKLQPGATQKVVVTVKYPRSRKGGAYAMMHVAARNPKGIASKQMIATVAGIGVILEVGLPGNVRHQFNTAGVYATKGKAKGDVDIWVAVENQGEIHEKLGGTVTITDGKKNLGTVKVMAQNVFPGHARHLRGAWKLPKGIKPGKYQLKAAMGDDLVGRRSGTGELEILKNGEVAHAKAMVSKFKTPPVVQRTAIPFEAQFTNSGNVPLAPTGVVTIVSKNGAKVASTTLRAASAVAPGQKANLVGTLPGGLTTGEYSVRLELTGPQGAPLASFSSTLQVIDKKVVMAAKIGKFSAPNAKEPYCTVELKNDGNVGIESEGIILINDSSGNMVGQIVLDRRAIAAGATEAYKMNFPKDLESGIYELQAVVNYGGSGPAKSSSIKYFKQ